MFGSFVAKPNLNSVNAIHSRVAGGSAPQNLNARAWKEPKVGEIMAHLIRQVDAFHHACAAYFRVTQSQNIHRTAYPTKLVLFTIRQPEDLCRTLWLQVRHQGYDPER